MYDEKGEYIKYVGAERNGSKINIPQNVTSCRRMFEGSSIKTPPVIPDGVRDCSYMFKDCEYLKHAPDIPDGVKTCASMFSGCESLEYAPEEIPSSVEDTRDMLRDCISLSIAPTIPDGVEFYSGMFFGCRALEEFPDIPYGMIADEMIEGYTFANSSFRDDIPSYRDVCVGDIDLQYSKTNPPVLGCMNEEDDYIGGRSSAVVLI